jgi:hypothetical protein
MYSSESFWARCSRSVASSSTKRMRGFGRVDAGRSAAGA